MNRSVLKLFYAAILLLTITSAVVIAQVNVQGNIETGLYKSAGDILTDKNDLMFALEGKFGYKYEMENTELVADLKLRPEFYTLKNELSTLTFRANGDFQRREENFDWGLNIKRQYNKISGRDFDLNYDIFSLQGNTVFYWIENIPIAFLLGYAYQTIDPGTDQNHDIIYFEGKANSFWGSYFRIGYGIYIEKFTIEGEVTDNFIRAKEKITGYRVGPEIELYYLKDFVINGQYRLLQHISDRTEYPSFEHSVRLVAGKLIESGFSIFLLVDYCLRDIKRKEVDEQISILYSPFNLENQISLKIGYDLSDTIELYIKGSYFRNDLVYKDYLFEGGNLLFGIELLN
ncbi:MAG: hypothetical protein AB1521_07300 [Bacteroidota bacterium]